VLAPTAVTIIERRSGALEPASFRDRYQDALRKLVEAKTKRMATTRREVAEPPKVINLMEVLEAQPRAGHRAVAEESSREQPTRANPVNLVARRAAFRSTRA
jgi:DNA end-binding protein Ku